MIKTCFVLFLGAGILPAAAPPAARAAQPIRLKMVRDFTLHIEHDLGAAEAKRRVASRIESLRKKFGDKLDAAEIDWDGNEADVRVKALSQSANGHISIDDSSVDVRVHLPLLLSGFGDQVRNVLNDSAVDALK